MPFVTTDATLGHVLIPNGDASFSSGVMSRTTIDGSRGLGLEARVSHPLTALQWQRVTLSLDPNVDSLELARWDRRTGSPLSRPGPAASCHITLPSGEGPDARRRANLAGVRDALIPTGLLSGAPFLVRLQVFPDGRCGVAINGKPIGVVETPHRSSGYRIRVEGAMVGTRIAVGPVDVWTGIRPGIDWMPSMATRQP